MIGHQKKKKSHLTLQNVTLVGDISPFRGNRKKKYIIIKKIKGNNITNHKQTNAASPNPHHQPELKRLADELITEDRNLIGSYFDNLLNLVEVKMPNID